MTEQATQTDSLTDNYHSQMSAPIQSSSENDESIKFDVE
jgi:hypothetical protein